MLSPNLSCFENYAAGRDGNFYGTTTQGGDGWPSGDGNIFKVTPTGKLTNLVMFDSSSNGAYPSGLAEGRDGNLYGTTGNGGTNGTGTIFKVTPAGLLTTLFSFSGDTNGGGPFTGLKLGNDGNFYGVTYYGGTYDFGTIFKITPAGVLTTLLSFDGTNGTYPTAPLVQGRDGKFYGTTATEGLSTLYSGTVFAFGPVSYNALFYQTNGVTLASSGTLQLTVDLVSSVRGTIVVGGVAYSFVGQLDDNTHSATVTIHRRRMSDLILNLQWVAPNFLSGTVSDGTWTAQVIGDQAANFSGTDATSLAGRYSFDLITASDGAYSPGWGSSGRVTVLANGAITMTGVLSDETIIGQTSAISASGDWPLFVSLYGGKGALLGWISFTNQPASRFNGSVSWIKTGGYGSFYLHGFTNMATAVGSIKGW